MLKREMLVSFYSTFEIRRYQNILASGDKHYELEALKKSIASSFQIISEIPIF